MPRHTPDYAPFRALLSAPYPLPRFITRPEPLTGVENRVSVSKVPATKFPYDPDWRNRQPAILPVPYPKRTPEEDAQAEQRKGRRARMKKERRLGKEVASCCLEVEDALAPVRNLHAITKYHKMIDNPQISTTASGADISITDLFVNHICTREEKQALEALEALVGQKQSRITNESCVAITADDTTLLISPDIHRRLRQVLGLPKEPYYSPMAIDPRSSDGFLSSWPHPLPKRETISLVSPTALIARPKAGPVSGLTRGLVLQAPPSRAYLMPEAKACHNFLLAKRVQAGQKKAVKDHNLAIFALAQRTGRKLALAEIVSEEWFPIRRDESLDRVSKRVKY